MSAEAPTNAESLHFYLPSFAGGGAERIFIRLTNHLASRGHPVCLIVNNEAGPLRDALSAAVPLMVLGTQRAAFAVPALTAYLRKTRPPVLIAALSRTNIAALLAARLARTGTRVIVCERNTYSAFVQGFDPLRRVLLTQLVRWLYPSAHCVIGNTGEVTRDIADVAALDHARTGIIHNPAPSLDLMDAARASHDDHPWFDDDAPVAVAIGRLVAQKDYPTMMRAVAMSRSDLRLLVLGDGPDRQKLEALVTELGLDGRVEFLGYRMNRFSYLVRADLFLLSSRTEGFPNALIEAVTAGIPAISTDCAGGGAREIIGQEFPARIVPVGDANAMARVIQRSLTEAPATTLDDLQRTKRIAERYHIDRIADAFLERARAR